ncbi:ANTAR domain-containing protein [Streptomyces sp. NPDC004324]
MLGEGRPTENSQLWQAVESHAVVDQAIGVLIAVYWCSATDAGEALHEVSQHTNTKLRNVADTVVDSMQGYRCQTLSASLWRTTPADGGRTSTLDLGTLKRLHSSMGPRTVTRGAPSVAGRWTVGSGGLWQWHANADLFAVMGGGDGVGVMAWGPQIVRTISSPKPPGRFGSYSRGARLPAALSRTVISAPCRSR